MLLINKISFRPVVLPITAVVDGRLARILLLFALVLLLC